MTCRCNTFGDDLLFDESAVTRPTHRNLSARYAAKPLLPDKVTINMSPKRWYDYRRDALIPRGLWGKAEATRISGLRVIEREKRKCPGRWNPRTGCRPEKWYRPVGRSIERGVSTVADSPITKVALTAAAFTPLAPVAVGVGVGLAGTRAVASGMARGKLDPKTVRGIASGISPYGGAVYDAGSQFKRFSEGKGVDYRQLGNTIVSAIPAGHLDELTDMIPSQAVQAYQQARGYQRQAQSYVNQARGYQRQAQGYIKQARGYQRQAQQVLSNPRTAAGKQLKTQARKTVAPITAALPVNPFKYRRF